MASSPITSRQIEGGKVEAVADFIFLGSKITADGDCSHEIKRCLLLARKAMTNLDSIVKGRDITLPTKVLIVKAIVCPTDMHRCERWTIKKAECWRIDAFKLWYWRRLEGPLDCKEITPVNHKGDQPWIFIGRTDAKAEIPILWSPDAKNWLAGKDWRQKGKQVADDKMVGWHHWLNEHQIEQTPGSEEPGVLQSTGLQWVGHNLATEQQATIKTYS